MPGFESTPALLHLSAVVAVLTLAYVRLDKTDVAPDELEKSLRELEETAGKIRTRFSLTDAELSQLDKSKIFVTWKTVLPACIICMVSKAAPRIRLRHVFLLFFYAAVRIPLIKFFQNHAHRSCMFVFAIASTAIFCGTAMMAVWGVEIPDKYIGPVNVLTQDGYNKVSAAILVIVLAFAIVTGAAAQLLETNRLIRLLREMETLLERRLMADLEDTRGKMDELLAKVPNGGVA